jgi:Fe-S cluster assembly iron-binding protein IscA
MLQVTAEAAELINEVRREQAIPETHGLRIYGRPTGEGLALNVEFTESPEEGDQITEQQGTQLFVAPEVAEPLSDAFIDVEEKEEGSRLVLRSPQPG